MPQTAEDTELPVVLGLPVAFEGTAVLEHTAAAVVVVVVAVAVGRDKEPADKGRDTGTDPLLGPWDQLMVCCSRLICSLVHRRLGRFQGRFGSLRKTKLVSTDAQRAIVHFLNVTLFSAKNHICIDGNIGRVLLPVAVLLHRN